MCVYLKQRPLKAAASWTSCRRRCRGEPGRRRRSGGRRKRRRRRWDSTPDPASTWTWTNCRSRVHASQHQHTQTHSCTFSLSLESNSNCCILCVGMFPIEHLKRPTDKRLNDNAVISACVFCVCVCSTLHWLLCTLNCVVGCFEALNMRKYNVCNPHLLKTSFLICWHAN